MQNITIQNLMKTEPFAAGYLAHREEEPFARISHGHACYLSQIVPAAPDPRFPHFYPCGRLSEGSYRVNPEKCFAFNRSLPPEGALRELLLQMDDAFSQHSYGNMPHTVAGFCYTHSLPHYGRIAREGLDSYRERILRCPGDETFKNGLLVLLDGIAAYREHCLQTLRQAKADPALITALEKVPFRPAETIYEVLVCWNFVYHLDGCDNVGRLDEDLLPFWQGEDITLLLREFFEIVDLSNGYSASIGPRYNGLTLQCLRAVKGLRRPQIELRVTPEMPDEIWEAAAESLAAGGTNPSLYNEEGYRKAFAEAFPHIPEEDFLRFCGVGCTESSLAGLSNVGSLDAGIHLPYIFDQCMRKDLADSVDFADFYERFLALYRKELDMALDQVYQTHALRAKYRPIPMRTLIIDDCIDVGREFYDRGARYHWSVINFAGIVNLLEDMLAVRELVFIKKKYTPAQFIEKLAEEDVVFRADCRGITHFGVNDSEADALAHQLTEALFRELERYTTYQGGKYIASSIQFNCCASAGRNIPASPDGRAAGASLADSLSAIHGYDTDGLTAMLSSAAAIDQQHMPGTPVLNLKLSKSVVKNHLAHLTKGYFASGGLQIQISCLSREDLLDAMEHPELHGNLVVRVGGYSDYFVRLSEELKHQILSRTEYK